MSVKKASVEIDVDFENNITSKMDIRDLTAFEAVLVMQVMASCMEDIAERISGTFVEEVSNEAL